MQSVVLSVRNPVAEKSVITPDELAKRPKNLNGATLGLFWNQKTRGDVALERLGLMAQDRFDVSLLRMKFPNGTTPPEAIVAMVEQATAVVAATAD